jgi:hypothetical protein
MNPTGEICLSNKSLILKVPYSFNSITGASFSGGTHRCLRTIPLTQLELGNWFLFVAFLHSRHSHSSSRRQCHHIETVYRNCTVLPYSLKQPTIHFTACQITLPDIKCLLRLILMKLHTITDTSILDSGSFSITTI